MSDERTPPQNHHDESPILQRQAVVHAAPPEHARAPIPYAIPIVFFLACAIIPLIAMLARSSTHTTHTTVIAIQGGDLEGPRGAGLESDAVDVRDEPIGDILTESSPSRPDRAWRGVAASPGRLGMSAVWSDTELFVSRDDGRSYRQVLGGPGTIGAAVVDERGVVSMVRDHQRLGVYASPGHEIWRDLPFAGDTLALATGHGWLAWLGLAHDEGRSARVVLAVSDDLGRSWRTQWLGTHADEARMVIEDGGALHILLVIADVRGPTMSRLLGHVDGRAVEPLPWPTDHAAAWGLGHGGWAYAIASECAAPDNDICAMGPERSGRISSTHTRTDWDLHTATNGTSTLGISGDRLLRFEGTSVTGAVDRAPTGISSLAVDGIERLLAVRGRRVLRYSPPHGWRVLLDRDPAE